MFHGQDALKARAVFLCILVCISLSIRVRVCVSAAYLNVSEESGCIGQEAKALVSIQQGN